MRRGGPNGTTKGENMAKRERSKRPGPELYEPDSVQRIIGEIESLPDPNEARNAAIKSWAEAFKKRGLSLTQAVAFLRKKNVPVNRTLLAAAMKELEAPGSPTPPVASPDTPVRPRSAAPRPGDKIA